MLASGRRRQRGAGRAVAPAHASEHGRTHLAHAHQHDHAHGGHGRALGLSLVLVSVVLVAELLGAWLSGSLALLSDAAHMFTDAAALSISLAATRLARRPPDPRRTFGYHRFEILAAAANAVLLLLAGAYIAYEAWRRIEQPPALDADLMLWIAVLGLAVNLVSMRLLAAGQRDNLNIRGAYLEVWSDMLGSVGVIVGAIAIKLTGWEWLDSAIALGIALWIVPRAWALLRTTMNVLLEGAPEDTDVANVEQALAGCEGVAAVHDLHVWSIASGKTSLSVHVVAAPPHTPGDVLLGRIRRLLAERFDIHHSTVQIEEQPCEHARERHGFGPAEPT